MQPGHNLDYRNGDNTADHPIPEPIESEVKDAVWGVKKWGEPFTPFEVNIPKPDGYLVKIEADYSGICHTDLHVAMNHLGGTMYPCVPGHELVGRVVAIGDKVTKFKVGDLAGIGAVGDSCLECGTCKCGDEQYCEKAGWCHTYNAKKVYGHFGGNQETQTFGGYSVQYCHHEHFCVKLPADIDLSKAGPLMCAAITLFDPLKFHGMMNCTGKTIGIIGIGGLGTMGIKLAKAMGHTVVAVSTSNAKEAMSREKGASHFCVSKDEESMKKHAGMCDLILNTISAPHEVSHYLGLLKTNGTIVQLGVIAEPHTMSHAPLIFGRKAVAGSLIGGIANTEECVDFCMKHNIYPDVQIIEADKITWAFEQLSASNKDGIRYVIDVQKSKQNKSFMP